MTETLHIALEEAASAAQRAYRQARESFTRSELENIVSVSADGTSTMIIDQFVEQAVVEAVARLKVNLLSEELGFVDEGSHLTVVADPLDGSANAAAHVPVDHVIVEQAAILPPRELQSLDAIHLASALSLS